MGREHILGKQETSMKEIGMTFWSMDMGLIISLMEINIEGNLDMENHGDMVNIFGHQEQYMKVISKKEQSVVKVIGKRKLSKITAC